MGTPQTVGEVMTTALRTVAPDARLEVAARLMERHAVRQLLVVEDDRLVGLVSYRDLLHVVASRRPGELERGVRVREIMDPEPVTFSPATPLRYAIKVLMDKDLSAAPVIDDDALVGIISEHDIVPVAGRLMDHAGE